jgi:hypothetical protein
MLIGRGVLMETGSGGFWIDREAVELEARRRRRALKLMLVLILAGLVIAAGISMALLRERPVHNYLAMLPEGRLSGQSF